MKGIRAYKHQIINANKLILITMQKSVCAPHVHDKVQYDNHEQL